MDTFFKKLKSGHFFILGDKRLRNGLRERFEYGLDLLPNLKKIYSRSNDTITNQKRDQLRARGVEVVEN